jgi:hypothetical protein
MVEFASLSTAWAAKRVAAYAAIVAVLGGAGGYAIHEHNAAQHLQTDNAQTTAALNATQHELGDLTAKVNMLTANSQAQQAQQAQTAPVSQKASAAQPATPRRPRVDPRIKQLQSQLDAQGKAIEQTRTDLAGTQGDLTSARTELSGNIAHTHDELVLLEKKGERNYIEFDLSKAKQFQREGSLELRLKKANNKHQYADMEMLVDDRNLSQKHVNLYQPVMFYTPDSPQPVEIVINSIDNNRIHGYVSAPKYRKSELASMASVADNTGQAQNPNQGQNQNPADSSSNSSNTPAPNSAPAPREKLPVPQP